MKIYQHPIFKVGDMLTYKDQYATPSIFCVMAVTDKTYKLKTMDTLLSSKYSLSTIHRLLELVESET